MSELQFKHYVEQSLEVVAISGNITTANVAEFNAFLNPILDKFIRHRSHRVFALDLKEVFVMDSSGIGGLCGKYIRIKKNQKKLVLCNTRKTIVDMLTVTGLDKTLSFFDSVPDALTMLGVASTAPPSEFADFESKPRTKKKKSLNDFIDEKLRAK